MLQEKYFNERSAYAKPIDPEWEAIIAKKMEEDGYIDLDDPNAPRRKIERTAAQLKEYERIRRKKAREQAQIEHQKALENIASGNAELRQKGEPRTVLIAKKAGRPKTSVAKPVSSGYTPAHKRSKTSLQSVAQARRADLIERFKNGEHVIQNPLTTRAKDQLAAYQQQRTDLKEIAPILKQETGKDIVRIRRIKDNETYLTLDCFERYQTDKQLTGDDNQKLFMAIISKKMVSVDSIAGVRANVVGANAMTRLARRYGFNIHTVMLGRKVIGWVAIDEVKSAEQVAREKEIVNLTDALDAVEHLTNKNGESCA